VPVSGQVLIDGEPLTHGQVRFIHSSARASTGELDDQGCFTLRCFDDGDGAVPGLHAIEVDASQWVGELQRKWHAPQKYANYTTSGLQEEISEATPSLTIQLTWGSDSGPYIQRLE
jgi:hypothetical protein